MELILPHIQTDFDALASAVAAQRLHPQAQIVFPGSQERNVRDFLALYPEAAPSVKMRRVRPEEVTRLILVDLNSPGRLGSLAKLLNRPGIEIVLYDHHPAHENGIAAAQRIICECGATTTLLVRMLAERRLPITPLEATLYMLGIYEETGNLTFTSTTSADLEAAAYLLQYGAKLSLVADFIQRELQPEQQELFDDLLKSRETLNINGLDVSLAQAERPFYVPDLAMLAHKLRDLENLSVLFILCRMDGRIYLVARSRLAAVDVNAVAVRLGGGGHATAASASIQDTNLKRLRKRLLNLLHEHIKPVRTARDVMSSPAVAVGPDAGVAEARQLMARHGHSGLPVAEGERVVGIITLRDADQALHHGLDQARVRDVMATNPYTVEASEAVTEIQRRLLEYHLDYVPVLEGTRLAGIVTRADLLAARHEQEARREVRTRGEAAALARAGHNLAGVLRERLTPRWLHVLHAAGELADRMRVGVYIVGGSVRDILLNVEHLDIDLAVEGDGIAFARRLAGKFEAGVKTHPHFGTAWIKLPGGLKLDIATARTEYYTEPAALPQVSRAAGIRTDLYRRDFSINAMAIQINAEAFGRLHDYFGGQRDLAEGVIRVLHAMSFVDDPTRIFRAVRFEQRYDFNIEPDTERYIRNAMRLDLVGRLAYPRLFDELMLILNEEQPAKSLRRLAEFDALTWVHPKLERMPADAALFGRLGDAFAFAILYLDEPLDRARMHLLAFLDTLTPDETRELAGRFQWPRRIRDLLMSQKTAGERVRRRLEQSAKIHPARAVRLMESLTPEVLLFESAKLPPNHPAQQWIYAYLSRWRKVRPVLTGQDLRKLGYPPGPAYERILSALRAARLDGKLATRAEEERFLRKRFPLPPRKTM